MLARNFPVIEDEIGFRATADDVLPVLIAEEQLIAEVLSLDDADAWAVARGLEVIGIVAVEREHDAANLNLIAGADEPPLAGIERYVADGAVWADRDESDLADLRVLVVDAGDVETDLAALGTPEREDAGAELDAARLAEGASGRDDQMHAVSVSHVPQAV